MEGIIVSEVGQTDISVLPPLHMESEHADWWLLGWRLGTLGEAHKLSVMQRTSSGGRGLHGACS